MEYSFPTDGPVDLVAEIAAGTIEVDARDTAESQIVVEGPDADETDVELRGSTLSVIGPKPGFSLGIGRTRRLRVTAVVPNGSSLSTKSQSADVSTEGSLGRVRVKSGSGDITVESATGDVTVEVGSGDVKIDSAESHVRIRSGSGDINVGRTGGSLGVVSGAGDVVVASATGPTNLKSGSGDLTVNDGAGELDLTTGSGDITIGRVADASIRAKVASGDICVCVPAGTPVWTDISTVTGQVRSTVAPTGEPSEGQSHVELRARTVSGDVLLQNI